MEDSCGLTVLLGRNDRVERKLKHTRSKERSLSHEPAIDFKRILSQYFFRT
jgi:hypothetical protein